ncbi:MAG: acyl-ACP--UDP-N-acetylglucosamine O-acyltransferase [Armatimonadota bacterium]|nr:MAG: acyl-ACP--UDP-N-acetylglucosamine O-acyltransferase [Armatimonadota bacterium]
MTSHHPTAIINEGAQLGVDVSVGAYAIISGQAVIGDRCRIGPHVFIDGHTQIGADTEILFCAALGCPPQDRKYKGEPTSLIIGERNIIHEYVTIHRGSREGTATRVGDDNMIMAYSHLGHNCDVGSGVTMVNNAVVAGHVVIEDRAMISGLVGIHQFTRIGKLAMVAGYSRVVQDVPPFMIAEGSPARVRGLNVVGLRRAGVDADARNLLKSAYRILYRSGLNLSQALDHIAEELEETPELQYLVDFLNQLKFGYVGRQFDRPPSGPPVAAEPADEEEALDDEAGPS